MSLRKQVLEVIGGLVYASETDAPVKVERRGIFSILDGIHSGKVLQEVRDYCQVEEWFQARLQENPKWQQLWDLIKDKPLRLIVIGQIQVTLYLVISPSLILSMDAVWT